MKFPSENSGWVEYNMINHHSHMTDFRINERLITSYGFRLFTSCHLKFWQLDFAFISMSRVGSAHACWKVDSAQEMKLWERSESHASRQNMDENSKRISTTCTRNGAEFVFLNIATWTNGSLLFGFRFIKRMFLTVFVSIMIFGQKYIWLIRLNFCGFVTVFLLEDNTPMWQIFHFQIQMDLQNI